MRQMLLLAAALAAVTSNSLADESKWDLIQKFRCSDVVTPSGHFTDKTMPMFIWLVGYLNGMAAASNLDKRLLTLGSMGSSQIGPLILAYCEKKQDQTILSATAGVAEMFINAQSGKRIQIFVPN